MMVILRNMYKPVQCIAGSSIALLSSYFVLDYIIKDNERYNKKRSTYNIQRKAT